MNRPIANPRIAIAYHPALPLAQPEAQAVAAHLRTLGIEALLCDSVYHPHLRESLEAGECDVLIALGGDGTMLRAGRLVAPFDVPVLGINAGSFGFLTELGRGGWADALPLLLAGNYRLERRMMLRCELLRAEKVLETWDVLNEVVVCRGRDVRPIQVSASVDGLPMTTYIADGLIVSTATGSTAYALAAGGPIMPPELRNLLIIPVAPHLSLSRAIILSEGVQVDLAVHTKHEAVVSADGHNPLALENDDIVRVYAGTHGVSFIRFKDQSDFYRNLTKYMEHNPSARDEA